MRIPAPLVALARWFEGRPRKWAVRAIAALLSLYVLYVVAAWCFLSWGGPTWLTHSAEDAHLEVAGGYSLWPGVFRLQDPDLQFKDYNIEMRIRAERIDVTFELFPLTKKQIVVDELVALGARYSMLHRVKDGASQKPRLDAFPVIPQFDRPKVYESPPPPPSEDNWTLQVNSLRAELEEAWLLEYRLRGRMFAQGGFFVGDQVRVQKSLVRFARVDTTVGGSAFLSDFDGEIEAKIASFESGAPIGEVVPKISGRVAVTAQLDSVSPVNLYMDEREPRVDGSGALALKLQILDGGIHGGQLALDVKDWKTSPAERERRLKSCSECILPLEGSANGQLMARLEPSSNWLESKGQLMVRQVALPLGDFRTQTTGKLEWGCHGPDGTLQCDPIEIRLSHVELASEDSESTLWVNVLGKDVWLNWQKRSLDAVLAVGSSDPKDLVRMMAEDSWPAQIGLSLVKTGELSASVEVVKDESTYVIALHDLKSGSVDARGHLVAASSIAAAWMVDLPLTRWGVTQRKGSSKVHPLIGEDWLERQIDEM